MRLALRWLSENSPVTQETIAEAGVRFDLSPLEEEFLYRKILAKTESREQ